MIEWHSLAVAKASTAATVNMTTWALNRLGIRSPESAGIYRTSVKLEDLPGQPVTN